MIWYARAAEETEIEAVKSRINMQQQFIKMTYVVEVLTYQHAISSDSGRPSVLCYAALQELADCQNLPVTGYLPRHITAAASKLIHTDITRRDRDSLMWTEKLINRVLRLV